MRRALTRRALQVRGVNGLESGGLRDRVDFRAEEKIANESEDNFCAHSSLNPTRCRSMRPLWKRLGAQGERSTGSLRPSAIAATASPVSIESRMPLRKCPTA